MSPVIHPTNAHVVVYAKYPWKPAVCLLLLCIVSLSSNLYAQKDNLTFDHISLEQGLGS